MENAEREWKGKEGWKTMKDCIGNERGRIRSEGIPELSEKWSEVEGEWRGWTEGDGGNGKSV